MNDTAENRLISVIMGLYNCSDTVSTAIESIISQTYENWELIMCDDGSSDNTYDVAKFYVTKYPEKIKLLRHEKNMYLAKTLNDCLSIAQGYYIARMDADDISMPNRFQRQVEYLCNHPEFQLVGTSMQLFNENGDTHILSRIEYPDKYTLRNGTVFNHPTIMTYKHIYDELGGYTVSERTRRGQDYDLWFRFYASGFKGANIQEPLYRFKEDMTAVKRRTAKGRIAGFQTMVYGYQLLHYPWYWYVTPMKELLKILVPSKIAYLYKKKH